MPRRRAPNQLRPAEHGLTHAYVGDGKGKTTAAVGTAVRAAGYGWRVLFLQFMKSPSWPSGERESLKKLGIEVLVFGEGFYKILNDKKPETEHKTAALNALMILRDHVFSGKYQLVVADELGTAVEEKLLDREPVEQMLKDRIIDSQAKMVNLIWTGHEKITWMLKFADLVTDMKMVKHPYYQGIIATKGIDY